MRLSTSAVAACCSRACRSSRLSWAISVFALAGLDARTAFGVLPPFRAAAVRLCDFFPPTPAPDRGFIAYPEPEDKASVGLRLARESHGRRRHAPCLWGFRRRQHAT